MIHCLQTALLYPLDALATRAVADVEDAYPSLSSLLAIGAPPKTDAYAADILR